MAESMRVLYVEDDEDVRDTLTLLLEHDGYAVTAVATAEDALEELARGGYALLLTDYQLPEHNADWLVRTASDCGYLRDTRVILLSGAHDPAGTDELKLLRKPVSQEVLLGALDEALATRLSSPPHPSPTPSTAELQLSLFVSGTSPASRKARRNLALVLRDVDPARVAVVVHDIDQGDGDWANAVEAARIVVIPTLVRELPQPRVWIAGDLSPVDVVRDAIVPAGLLASSADHP